MLPRATSFVLFLAATAIQGTAALDFEWDCTNSLGTCNNACYAIYKLKLPSKLTYDSNNKNADPRRVASGCSKTPCSNTALAYSKFGGSCDEFPFASTTQGGKGAILRCVAPSENSSEGGQLGNFYKKIKSGDSYNVFIRNYKGAKFCDTTPTPANDGGEFKLSGSTFVSAKNRRGPEFEDAEPEKETDEVASQFREYEDEEGGRVLSLSTDGVSMVGHSISNGNRTLLIIKEIPRE